VEGHASRSGARTSGVRRPARHTTKTRVVNFITILRTFLPPFNKKRGYNVTRNTRKKTESGTLRNLHIKMDYSTMFFFMVLVFFICALYSPQLRFLMLVLWATTLSYARGMVRPWIARIRGFRHPGKIMSRPSSKTRIFE
jgi:hypothetical protein